MCTPKFGTLLGLIKLHIVLISSLNPGGCILSWKGFLRATVTPITYCGNSFCKGELP